MEGKAHGTGTVVTPVVPLGVATTVDVRLEANPVGGLNDILDGLGCGGRGNRDASDQLGAFGRGAVGARNGQSAARTAGACC